MADVPSSTDIKESLTSLSSRRQMIQTLTLGGIASASGAPAASLAADTNLKASSAGLQNGLLVSPWQ